MSKPGKLDVLILCGGLGTRLASVMKGRQKVLAEIGEAERESPGSPRPFLVFLRDYLLQQGFRRFIFCTGFGAEEVESKLTECSCEGAEAVFSREPTRLGTAGAVKNAERLIRSEHFFVVNGDSFCPFEYGTMRVFHEQAAATATIALVSAEPSSDGGFVHVAAEGRITGFREKSYVASHLGAPDHPAFLNAGTYLFGRSVLDMIPAGKASSLETELFPRLIENIGKISKGLYGYKTGSRLHDIGTPERLEHFRRECTDI